MQRIYPRAVKPGAHIRVVSPSSSLTRVGGMEGTQACRAHLERLGFTVSFGEHILANDIQYSASIAERVADIHAGFADTAVDMVLCTIGGFNSVELLPYLDWELIRANPKAFCGYSDITALNNAMFAKTGLVSYSGPGYSAFRMKELQDYQSATWLQAIGGGDYTLTASEHWSSDLWFLPDAVRNLLPNEWSVYNHGEAVTGTVIGANMSTFVLLQGTAYFPQVSDPILFMEVAEEASPEDFTRYLASILLNVPNPRAVVFGRPPKEANISEEVLLHVLDKHPVLKTIPVMYNVNFGHAQPIFTFPIGAQITVDTAGKKLLHTRTA